MWEGVDMGGCVDSEASEVGEDGMRFFVSNCFFWCTVFIFIEEIHRKSDEVIHVGDAVVSFKQDFVVPMLPGIIAINCSVRVTEDACEKVD
jgi:hypothetical protein